MKLKRITLYLVASVMALPSVADVHRQSLDKGWTFRGARETQSREATVPGTVHTDLLSHGQIPDPYIGQNERLVQWVDKEDWIYETAFDLDTDVAGRENIDIVFEGLDTYADVYLNDSLILNADNMFRTWTVPVKGIAKEKDNKLKVYLHSPIKTDIPKYDALPYHYYAGNDQSQNGGVFDKRVSVFARKAPYHYGWDWGPRLVTSGIWRPAYIEAYDGPRISDIFIRTTEIKNGKAYVTATVTVDDNNGTGTRRAMVSITPADADGQKKTASKEFELRPGVNTVTIPLVIDKPKLWWSNGIGEQHMYDFTATLSVEGKKTDSSVKRSGLRTIELVKEDDADGRSFYFRLNGVPVFAKGANYIPNDIFLPRVGKEGYDKILGEAVEANMNMLRVWGGGVYEDDYFYELCDSLGIMVWQDFMFACSMYPADSTFLEKVRPEAIDNIKRLRNHPSIALWCGNNEILEGWQYWGIRPEAREDGSEDLQWQQYLALFHNLLPEIVEEYAPGMSYTPSSPYTSLEESRDLDHGDFHAWNVWAWGEPVEAFDDIRARFMSEYGFQSFPELSTVMKYAPDTADHFITSNVMMAHQRGGTLANKRIEDYMLRSYPEPQDFEELLYMSQVQQADAMKRAIESHRRQMPYCMGSLYWQINDCWPVASWSSHDYYGNRKALHYSSRNAFNDILVSPIDSGVAIELFIVSDRLKKANGTLKATTYALDGSKKKEFQRAVTALPNGVSRIKLDKQKDLGLSLNNDELVYITFDDGNKVYENIWYPAAPKYLSLEESVPVFEISGTEGKYTIKAKSDKPVKSLYMSVPGEAVFSDNYFDMIPGKEYVVEVATPLTLDAVKQGLSWRSILNR